METGTKKWVEIFPKPTSGLPTEPTESSTSAESALIRHARKQWFIASRKNAVATAVDDLSKKFDESKQEPTPIELIAVILGAEYLESGFKADPLFSIFGNLFG